jgi:hypothetical protein
MNSTRLLTLARNALPKRNMSSIQVDRKMKERQQHFQIDNGLRVHERGGAFDKALYMFTSGVLLLGGVLWVKGVYDMAFPPKPVE